MRTVLQKSIDYLSSAEALTSIRENPYWPKWNSPWWTMSLFYEMGIPEKIPVETASLLLAEIKRTHLPYFFREDAPAHKAADQAAPCPCALGNIYQVLKSTGLDVDRELPWARSWFLKYQMPEGGLSCDEEAYRATGDPSSIVGTIAPLEAILKWSGPLTTDEGEFLDRGAQSLLRRELRLGSFSEHNAEERADEADWLKLCFPRFYFYDVLRGLHFLLLWSKRRQKIIPKQSVEFVVEHLKNEFPLGPVTIQRHSYEGVTSRKGRPASFFPLLEEVSGIGQESPYLTEQWHEALLLIDQLSSDGLIR